MGKKSTPEPPDYAAAAERTAESSAQAMRDQTYANRISQTNPWGSLNYESYLDVDPATGEQVTRWRQNQTLTPEAQAALDSQMAVQQGRSSLAEGMLGDIGQDYGERMNFDQYGDPIGMGPMDRMSGAGEGISAGQLGGIGRMPGVNIRDTLEGQNLEKNLDYSGAPDVNAPEWTRQAAEQSVYDRGASRLDPQIAEEGQALDVKLRSQGLQPGDEAYEAQMRSFNQRKTDAYDALSAQAMQEGARQAESMFGMESQYRDQATGEEDRMKGFTNEALMNQFGIGESIGQFGQTADIQGLLAQMQGRGQDIQARGQDVQQNALGLKAQGMGWDQMAQQMGYNQNLGFRENQLANALRTQGMNEGMSQRAYRLNELNSLLSGQQVNAPGFENFSQQGAGQAADYLGAAGTQFEAEMAAHSADQALMNSLMSGVGQGVGMAGMFSDRRLKSNIEKIGERNGVNWYSYEIFGRPQIGVMADEVPHAAFKHPSGFLMVDYSKV